MSQLAPEFNLRDSILFVIDARRAMCEPSAGGGPSPFAQALGCVRECMRDRVLSGERDQVGVVLFGTEATKTPSGQGFPNIYVLQDLDEPSAASMRNIALSGAAEAAAEAVGGADASGADAVGGGGTDVKVGGGSAAAFGHQDVADFDIASVLWVSSMLFNASGAKGMRRRIYLLTNDDAPCGTAPTSAPRQRALTRAKDLKEASVWLEPFFFAPPPPATFDLGEGSFWRELVGDVRKNYDATKARSASSATANGAGSGSGNDGSGSGGAANGHDPAAGESSVNLALLEEDRSETWLSTCVVPAADGLVAGGAMTTLAERVLRKAHRKRVLWSSELTIQEGSALSFLMVSIVRPTPKPGSSKLDARSNEVLVSNTMQYCTVRRRPASS